MKLGLVLSGGGARGLAHIGVLKALEEIGIHPDVITGASMGGIIGAMYSLGIEAKDLENMLSKLDFNELLEIRSFFYSQKENKILNTVVQQTSLIPLFTKLGFDSGRKIRKVFKDITQDKEFKDLKIPFSCVAVDLITERLITLNSGKLYEAMYATGAIPPYLEPLEKDGMLLADGGILSNAPVDVAKEMGAEKVILVDVNTLQTFRRKENFRNAFDIILRVLDITLDTLYIDELAKADYLIQIPLNFDIFDFDKKEEIIKIGYTIGKESLLAKGLKGS
ncbi:patatin-like phospholipase family protein [Caldisericum sp. AR60]|uniref:patatin-like phospholipase family protein n=1 Tax=Caldisericum sp. AR60 TaxID=3397852 RepID=UPI0039FD2ADA